MPQDLQSLSFDNSFVRELPGDPESRNERRQVLGAAYSRVLPTSVAAPRSLATSSEVADFLGLDSTALEQQGFADVFGGNQVLESMAPFAACYGGHQFGSWAGQLGDGRAITLGEVVNAAGQRWELQLKGAGPTPYSRTADGRAVMRSSVREFLCSEAMHHLGVPTTRALSLVGTGDDVVRDMFYDGHPKPEPGAVVCRVSPSFLRFGNFELPAARQDPALLKQLADYAITTHFPELGAPSPQTYVAWFDEVCRRTVEMIVHWMRVGFVHGVMNTDNMSILGLTIDYGPYGWLEDYDLNWTPNTTDANGRRYRYGHQPNIALWNLSRFGGALLALGLEPAKLEDVLRRRAAEMEQRYRQMLYGKLGLELSEDDLAAELADEQPSLVDEMVSVLQLTETDMTIFFRRIADLRLNAEAEGQSDAELVAGLSDAYYKPEELTAAHTEATASWLRRYAARLNAAGLGDEERRRKMNTVNPKYVLRNYIAQLAIDKAEQGDGSLVNELLEVLRHPYDEQPEHEEFAAKRPEWARNRPGCSMLSCSS